MQAFEDANHECRKVNGSSPWTTYPMLEEMAAIARLTPQKLGAPYHHVDATPFSGEA